MAAMNKREANEMNNLRQQLLFAKQETEDYKTRLSQLKQRCSAVVSSFNASHGNNPIPPGVLQSALLLLFTKRTAKYAEVSHILSLCKSFAPGLAETITKCFLKKG